MSKKKVNKKDRYQEGGSLDKTSISPATDELSKIVQTRIQSGEPPQEILLAFLQEGIPQEQLALAFESAGYDPIAFGDLVQNVEQMVMQAQQAQQMQAQQMQQAQQQAAQQEEEMAMEQLQQMQQQEQPEQPQQQSMDMGGSPYTRPTIKHFPILPERTNLIGAASLFADSFDNLFSKDVGADGLRKGTFQDWDAKMNRYKNKQLQNRTYEVDYGQLDPGNYMPYFPDLAEGVVRTKQQFADDVKRNSSVDFDPATGKYSTVMASRPDELNMLGIDQRKILDGISLSDFVDNVDALVSSDSYAGEADVMKDALQYPEGTGIMRVKNAPGPMANINTQGLASYVEEDMTPQQIALARQDYRDFMLGMRDGGDVLPKAQNGLAEFTAQVPVYNAAGECIMNCRNLRVDPKFDYEIGANLTAGMLNDKFTGSGKITSGFSFNPNRGLGGIDGYVGGNIGGRATVSDNDKVNINPFANLTSRLGYAGRLPRRRSGLFGAKGAPYGMGAFYNKSLMGNEGDVVGGYGRLGNFNVTGGYNTTTNTPQFTVGIGIPIKKSGGQSLPKAQMGNEPKEVDEVLAALQKQYSFPETIDMSELANIDMEPFEEQEGPSPFDLQNRLTAEQLAAEQAKVAAVGVLGSQISPDFTSGVSQVAQKAAENTMQQRQAQKNQDDFDLNQAANQIDWTAANEELDRIAYEFGQDPRPQEGMINIPKKEIDLTKDLNTIPGIKPQGLDTPSPSVKRKKYSLSNMIDQAETFIKEHPAMRAFGDISDTVVKGANLANAFYDQKNLFDFRNKARDATMADKIFLTREDPSNVRGTFDVNTGLMEPDNLVDYYGMAKKGGEFKPHMMYHPVTGEGYKANKPQDHIRMDEMGYVHKQGGGEVEVDNDTLAALIAAGADIEML